MKQFKIRASSAVDIVGGSIGLTDAQQRDYDTLTAKEKLTEKQSDKLASLEHKLANPELPKGLKTVCKEWAKYEDFGRKPNVNSKYMFKGHLVEDESIEAMAGHFGLGMVLKNEESFEDEYFTGTPDVLLADEVIDMKNSWDIKTFPKYEDEIPTIGYWWQLQVYMHLTGRRKARLVYTLIDTPEHFIEREARNFAWGMGIDEVDEVLYNEFKERMTFSHKHISKRIVEFKVEYDESAIKLLQERVKICRDYINYLNENYG